MQAKCQGIRARTRRQSTVGGLLLVLTSVIISAIAAEGALRVFNYPPTSIGWGWTDSPYRTPASQQGEINQLGLRGRMINYSENDFIIVLVGDSQVEVGVQSFEDLPEILLEQALNEAFGLNNIKVFSLASAGWGQDQQLISLDRYFRSYRANLILVWLSPGNDY